MTKIEKYTKVTPLHLARTPAIARLLIDYGADPSARNKKHQDALTCLMESTDTNDDVAQVIMDDYIETNGTEMDSSGTEQVFSGVAVFPLLTLFFLVLTEALLFPLLHRY